MMDAETLAQLVAFAKERGRRWKIPLSSYWYRGEPVPGYPLLYGLRNHPDYGFKWLDTFRLPKESTCSA